MEIMNKNNEIAISRKENALKKFSDSSVFLKQMNPTVCINRYAKCTSSSHCHNTKSAKINEISEWYGTNCAIDFVALQITTLNLFVNVSNHLNVAQIKEIAFWIFEKYHDLNIAEITMVISRIKLGDYGKLYNNLSGEFILDCFRQYNSERNKFLYEKKIIESNAFSSVEEFGSAIMGNLDKLPRVRHLLGKKTSDEEKARIEEEEQQAKIDAETYRLFNDKHLP